ncbi:DUF2877 domain-containing protein [Nocardioides anomalus]|uniref:DUF2877 domain-containing protein n=1 Tax=Nocardioides anomalus TaxID=2712223 RepID=A0A6G6WFG1_9ACTN|nr:DUF2877 domain-containing protein [Nocardioides anomalus]QIG43972.1 DUF2877 domain-containing protein [Nocardioides anomalus]
MVPVSAPPRVAALLRSAPDGPAPLVHRGPDAVYVEVAGRCVGVVGTRATAVPCALRTALPVLPDVVRASVRGGVLHLDDEPLVVGRYVAVSVPRLPLIGTPGAVDPAALVGRGDGLTPYGDDVLCGWLAVTRAAGVPTPEVDEQVRALAPTTTLLSATLLECAMSGEVVPEFGAWLAGTGSAEAVERIGHSSGRGLLEGARLALSGLERVAA